MRGKSTDPTGRGKIRLREGGAAEEERTRRSVYGLCRVSRLGFEVHRLSVKVYLIRPITTSLCKKTDLVRFYLERVPVFRPGLDLDLHVN